MAKRIDARLVLELLGKGMAGREMQRTRHLGLRQISRLRRTLMKERAGHKKRLTALLDQVFPEFRKAHTAVCGRGYHVVDPALDIKTSLPAVAHSKLPSTPV